jgi:hypothetical protein
MRRRFARPFAEHLMTIHKDPPMDLTQRSAGVLLHITSPGPHGMGDFGPDAYRFVDWLASAGQRLWQWLPSTPIGPATRLPGRQRLRRQPVDGGAGTAGRVRLAGRASCPGRLRGGLRRLRPRAAVA